MSKFRLEYLFTLYLQGKISLEENNELMKLIVDADNEDQIMDIIEDFAEHPPTERLLSEDASGKILDKILPGRTLEYVKEKNKKRFPFWMSVAATWLIVISLFGGIWLAVKPNKKNVIAQSPPHTVQILPGGNKAFLTLDDGTEIDLNEQQHQTKAFSTNIWAEKNDSILIYKNIGTNKNGSKYNKLTTPRGGQFQVLLPDGTKVWLNAESSIRYPIAFSDNERVVELTGEAFFKVQKLVKKDNSRVPFKINVKSSSGDNAVIQVLGTSFNVSAYENEAMFKVSLKHGKVKIEKGKKTQLLTQGQEAEVYNDNHISLVKNADIELATSWKNGIFLFENEDIKSIMKQVGRWYDVDVVYRGQYPTARFDGKISRTADITEVLRILKLSGVQFTVTDKTILVQ